MKKKIIYVIVVVVAVLVLSIPIMTQNQMYVSVTEAPDTVNTFIPTMNRIIEGESFYDIEQDMPYLGLAVTLWVIGNISKWTGISPSTCFVVYALIVLFLTGVTLYYLGYILGGQRAGWLVLVFALLCNTSILGLFAFGCIYNIVNVYILFLWAIICAVKWFEMKRAHWLAFCIILIALFVTMHPTGLYLPCIIVLVGVSYGAWYFKKYREIRWAYIAFGLTSSAVAVYFAGRAIALIDWRIDNWGQYSSYLVDFIRFTLQPVSVVIWVLTIICFVTNHQMVKLKSATKYVVVALGSLVITLLAVSALWLIEYTDRLMVDAGAMLSIMSAVVLAQLIKQDNLQWLKVSSYALLSLASLITLQRWIA